MKPGILFVFFAISMIVLVPYRALAASDGADDLTTTTQVLDVVMKRSSVDRTGGNNLPPRANTPLDPRRQNMQRPVDPRTNIRTQGNNLPPRANTPFDPRR